MRDNETITSFSWSTPADWRGDLGFALDFVFVADTECTHHVSFTAPAYEAPAHGMRAWAMSERGVGMLGYQSWIAHAHAGPVDTRDVQLNSGGWSGQGMFWGDGYAQSWMSTSEIHFEQGLRGTYPAGTDRWTYAGFDLGPLEDHSSDHDGIPFKIEMTCDDPFQVILVGGSLEVAGWSGQDLEGGAGVSTSLPQPARATALSGATTHFTTDAVRMQFQKDPGVIGRLTIDSDDGSREWDLDPLADRVLETLPGGQHQVTLTNAQATGGFGFVLVGLDPLASLDALLT